MKTILKTTLVLLFSIPFLFFQCDKDDMINNSQHVFTWNFQGNNYSASLDTAYTQGFGMSPFYIVAINGTHFVTNFNRKIEFTLTSFNPGVYTISSSTNRLTYIDDAGFNWSGISGTLNINSNANNQMSGSFNATMTGPSSTAPITGSFQNVPVKP